MKELYYVGQDNSLFAEQTAGLESGVGVGWELLGLLELLVEHGDEVAGLRLVQGHAPLVQLPLLHLHQVAAPETVHLV